MRPAILYAAKSTADVHGSIERQLADSRKLAEREGWQVVEEYSEVASAWSGSRGPELAKAKDHAAALGAVLVVQHSDRLARGDGIKADHLVEIALWARRAGVTMASVQDPSTMEGGLAFAAMMGDRNVADSDRKSEAVKSGMAGRRTRGMWNGGPEPYGYNYPRDDHGRTVPTLPLVVDETGAAIVIKMMDWVLEGYSGNKIARLLTAEGIPTQRGGPWRGSTVRRIVTNPIYCARAKDGTPMTHDPIISVERWQQVQEIMAARAKGPSRGGGRQSKANALFVNGHLRCGVCGDAMGPRSRPRRTPGLRTEDYHCRRHDTLGDLACTLRPVPMRAVEQTVLTHFRNRAAALAAGQAAAAEHRAKDRAYVAQLVEQARAEAVKARAAVARVDRAMLDGHLTPENYNNLKAQADSEHRAAAARLEHLEAQAETVAAEARPVAAAEVEASLMLLGALAERALAGEVDLEPVRHQLRQLFPVITLRPTETGLLVDLGDPAAEYVATLLDDEIPEHSGETVLRRVPTTGAVGLPCAPVVAPIAVVLEP